MIRNNMNTESSLISFDWTPCDIIGELQGKNIYDVTDHILFYLDWASLKNIGLVSKRWRAAMLMALRAILRKGHPNWNDQQRSTFLWVKSFVSCDFQVSIQDTCYDQRLMNSMFLILEKIFQYGYWTKPEVTLDFLPYIQDIVDIDEDESPIAHLCRLELNDRFIIAWELPTRLFKCWSRRTLSPINMDREFQRRNFPSISLDDVEKEFCLFGKDLFYAESSTSRRMKDSFAQVELTKVDLDARRRGIDEEEEFKASIYVEPPKNNVEMYIDYLNVVDDMILLGFHVYIDGHQQDDEVLTVQRHLEQGESRDVFKRDTLHLVSGRSGEKFFDEDYLVVSWDYPDEDVAGFRTYSLHPPKDGSKTVELRWIASFDLVMHVEIDYVDGLLAYSTADEKGWKIRFVDVSNGSLLKILSTPIEFSYSASLPIIMRLGGDFVFCSEETVAKGTTFHVWDLPSIMNQPHEQVDSAPVCTFRTFTSSVQSFEVDEIGIAAVIGKDSAVGIQVLSFLPACSHCKRLTRPALLTKCSVCKSAAYCSEECQTADWNHELICAKVNPLRFT